MTQQAGAWTFPTGVFTGQGHWKDKAEKDGDYITHFDIERRADESYAQVTHRTFYKEDGGHWYDEDSVVQFATADGRFLDVTVSAGSLDFHGNGYFFEDRLHYDMDLAPDNHLENTYIVSTDRIEIVGSATNKGKFTAWQEVLRRVR